MAKRHKPRNKQRTKRRFAPTFLGVLLATVVALLGLEFTCFILNLCEVRISYFDLPRIDPYKGGVQKFEIPNSGGLVKASGLSYNIPRTPDAIDDSQKIAPNYSKINSRDVLVPTPNQESRSVLVDRFYRQVIYDVTYSIDENSRRVTPQKNLRERKRHFLVLGCSYVYGEGVKDDETLPSQIAKNDSDFHVYNLGFSGYSPSSLWLESKFGLLMNNIKERDGAAVYVFLDDHLRRVFGSMDTVSTWGDYLPYVEIDDEGNLIPRGSFTSGRRLLTGLYKLFWETEIRKFFNLSHPNVFRREYIRRFSFLVQKLKEVYYEKTGSKKFYVAFFPGTSWLGASLMHELDRLGIKFINYGAMRLETLTANAYFPHDGHPASGSYEILGKLIAKDVLQKELK